MDSGSERMMIKKSSWLTANNKLKRKMKIINEKLYFKITAKNAWKKILSLLNYIAFTINKNEEKD